jgi:hypothetical protein
MKTFFEAIQSLFVNFLFKPFDWLRSLELTTWTFANIINWVMMGICAYYIVYWCKQIKETKTQDEQDTTAHSFLK